MTLTIYKLAQAVESGACWLACGRWKHVSCIEHYKLTRKAAAWLQALPLLC